MENRCIKCKIHCQVCDNNGCLFCQENYSLIKNECEND